MNDEDFLQKYLEDNSRQVCTNPEMHEKFADRGIEDQCPYCIRQLNELED